MKLDMWKLGLASQSSGSRELPEASLAILLEDLESWDAVSVALSEIESLAEPSLAFTGVFGLLANERIVLELRRIWCRTGYLRVRSDVAAESVVAFAPPHCWAISIMLDVREQRKLQLY